MFLVWKFSTLDFYANYSRKRKKDNAGKNAKGRENEIILQIRTHWKKLAAQK